MIKRMANHIDKRRVEEKREEVLTSSSLFSYVNLTSNSFFGTFFVEKQSAVRHGGA